MLKIAGCPLPLLFPPRPLSCWALQIVRASYEVCNLAGCWMDRPNTASALARCPDEMLVCPSYPSLERLCDELSKLNLQKGIHCHIPRCLVSSINAPRPRTSQGSMKFLLGQTRLLAQKTCCPPLHMSCTSLAIPPFPSGEWHAGRRDRVAAKPLPLCPPLSLPPSLGFARGWMSDGEIFASLRSVRITVSLSTWQFDEHLLAIVFLGRVSQIYNGSPHDSFFCWCYTVNEF